MDLELPGGIVIPDVLWLTLVVALASVGFCSFLLRRVRRSAQAQAAETMKVAARERERASQAERSLVLERARAVPAAERQEHLFASLVRGFQELGQCRGKGAVLQTLASAVERTFHPAQYLVLAAVDRDGKEFQIVAAGGECSGDWSTGARINDTMGRLGLVARRRVAMDNREFESQPPIVREQIAATEPDGFLIDAAAPIVLGDSVLALVSLGSPSMSPEAARAGLEMLTTHAVAVLRALDAAVRVERLHNTDAMTGLGSKSWFVAEGGESLYKFRTQGHPSALVVFGIDDFKGYVRRSGHEAADWLLKGVAEVVRPLCKDGALLARWSGAEFVALVPGASSRSAQIFADSVREAVSGVDWPNGAQQPHGRLTMSAGISVSPADGASLDDLIETAVERLILARRSGDATYGADPEESTGEVSVSPQSVQAAKG